MTSYCKVRWCRFSSTHVTKGHKCGTCGQYGHGETECNSQYYKDYLNQYDYDILPDELHCTVENCENKKYHTVVAHHCPKCQQRDTHSAANCQQMTKQQYDVKCPVCRKDNHIAKPIKLFGITDQCCICMDSVVDVLLPDCGHCCVCLQCLPMLPK
jgi:hypothetical protein